MNDSETPDVREPLALDPFSYFDGVRSKIAGLGGTRDRPDLGYAFHTHYVRGRPGPCSFVVAFDNLTATHGALSLQVHMLTNAPGSNAKLGVVERFALSDIVASGGQVSVRFESLRGQIYALFGRISGDTDAAAQGLTVTIDQPGYESDDQDPDARVAPTELGGDAVRPADRLLSAEMPSLGLPRSQPYSMSQLDDVTIGDIEAVVGRSTNPVERWEAVYSYRALQAYGMLQPGASGIVVGSPPASLLFAIRDSIGRLDVVGYDSQQQIIEGIAEWDRSPKVDFLLQSSSIEPRLVSDRYKVFEALLRRLRPGGLGICILPYTGDAYAETDWDVRSSLSQQDVQRFVLNFVSLGFDAAQISLGEKKVVEEDIPFAVVVRKSFSS